MSIVDCILDSRLTEWILVEVVYPTKTTDGDISVSSVFTETPKAPKTYDNSRGFTEIFPPCAYEQAKKYACQISEQLGIKACI